MKSKKILVFLACILLCYSLLQSYSEAQTSAQISVSSQGNIIYPTSSPTPTPPPSTNNLAPIPSGWSSGWSIFASKVIYPVIKGGETSEEILAFAASPYAGTYGAADREINSNWIGISPGDVVVFSAWFWTESSTIGDTSSSHGVAMGVDAYNGANRICEIDPVNGIGTPDISGGVWNYYKDTVPWGSGVWVHLTMIWTVPSSLEGDGFGAYSASQTVTPNGFIAWICGQSSSPGSEGAAMYVYGTVLSINS